MITRSRKLSLKLVYQLTHQTMICRSKCCPLNRSSIGANRCIPHHPLAKARLHQSPFGNSGPELLDQIRRLNRRLGVFLDRVQAGGRSVLVVFSADHGGLDFVERLQDQGIPAKRLDTDAWMMELQSRVRTELHNDKDLLIAGNDHFPNELYFAPEAVRQLGDQKEWVAKV